MVAHTNQTLPCPICGRPLDSYIAQFKTRLHERVVRLLRLRQPGWQPTFGVCPDCVQEAMNKVRRERSESSLHADLLLPYPVYARDEAYLLPTPLRTNANPKYRGRGITLAFLDSGFYPHPDLMEPVRRVLTYVDATFPEPVEKNNFKKAEATSWHGLMTSCVAAGNGFMSEGLFRSIASESQVVLVKTGNRRHKFRIPDKDIFRALLWAVKNSERYNIRIINISLGGDYPSTGDYTYLDALAEEAVAEGIVVVVAAGNGRMGEIIPPASAPSVITVGGLDDQNTIDPNFRRMWRSSYGRGVNLAPKPELIAPSIWVAAPILPRTAVHNEATFLWQMENSSDTELRHYLESPAAETRFKKETLRRPLGEIRRIIRRRMMEQKYIHPYYQHVDGTSMAAPIVTSIVAQMLEANSALTPAHIKDMLISTAEPLRHASREEQGYGMVSAARAVALALRGPQGILAGLPVSPHITSEAITFLHYSAQAQTVAVVGTFNRWQPAQGQMHLIRPGVWQFTLPRPPAGSYLYKFLVDRLRWTHDLEHPARLEDGYGGFHSVLTLE